MDVPRTLVPRRDAHGSCCPHPWQLDASQSCCFDQAGVDECGVCGGEAATCKLQVIGASFAPPGEGRQGGS